MFADAWAHKYQRQTPASNSFNAANDSASVNFCSFHFDRFKHQKSTLNCPTFREVTIRVHLRGYSIFHSEVNTLNISKEQKQIVQKKIWLYYEENMNLYFSQNASWNFRKGMIIRWKRYNQENFYKPSP